MKLELSFSNPNNQLFNLVFECENDYTTKLWIEQLKKFLKLDSNAKLETRWAGFNLKRRSKPILIDKLQRCIDTINNSWLNSEFQYSIDVKNIPQSYPVEIHNIVHHHFEILMGQVWSPSKWYKLMEEREDWKLIDAVRGLNDLSHELEAFDSFQPLLCTTFWHPNGVEKIPVPNEANAGFQLQQEFGAVYLHYAQLGKTWQEVCWDRDEEIFESNISPTSLISGEFDISFYNDPYTHQQHADYMKHWLKRFGKTPDDTSLRLGRYKVATLKTKLTQENILEKLSEFDQIVAVKIGKTKTEFEKYDDPY